MISPGGGRVLARFNRLEDRVRYLTEAAETHSSTLEQQRECVKQRDEEIWHQITP